MYKSIRVTRKLYIAAILHNMLPESIRNTEQAALGCAVLSGFLRLREL